MVDVNELKSYRISDIEKILYGWYSTVVRDDEDIDDEDICWYYNNDVIFSYNKLDFTFYYSYKLRIKLYKHYRDDITNIIKETASKFFELEIEDVIYIDDYYD